MPSVLITGANGQLGRRLIAALPAACTVEAVVRSARAERQLAAHVGARPGLRITCIDPADPAALAPLAARCERAVHLIGSIRESRADRYADAHERPARALAAAAATAGLRHIVYLSILGAAPASTSRCLRARAAVEATLQRAATPAIGIRVPMVLGEDDRASRALARRARARHVFLVRAASLEQPIYAGDVITALAHALAREPRGFELFDLAGPESLTRRALVERAAAALGRRPVVHSLPLVFGLAYAGALEALSARPVVTRDMLRVLDHDDAIDAAPAAAALGLELTALDAMLERCVGAADARFQDTIR